jgi:hypothetical protein
LSRSRCLQLRGFPRQLFISHSGVVNEGGDDGGRLL